MGGGSGNSAHGSRKTTATNGLSHGGQPWRRLSPVLQTMRLSYIQAGVSDVTNLYYRNRAAAVATQGGPGYGYEGFMQFVAVKSALEELKDHPHCGFLATTTLQQYKSACLHVSCLDDNPWTSRESKDVDTMLHYRVGAAGKPKQKRGQLTAAKIEQVENRAMRIVRNRDFRRDAVEGLWVVYGACCRGQGIGTLTRARLTEIWSPILWAKRKATATVAVQRGEFTPNPVCLERAIRILRTRARDAASDDDLLFPHWDPKTVTELVKRTAKECRWSDAVIWTGAHNARHGAGRDVFDKALEQVMAAGMWDSRASAELYGAPRQAIDAAMEFQRRLADSTKAAEREVAARRELPPPTSDRVHKPTPAQKKAAAAKTKAAKAKADKAKSAPTPASGKKAASSKAKK